MRETEPGVSAPPRYRLLADALRAEIISGALAPGDQLPTEMDLCARENVSRHTVRDALRILVETGLIERRRGAGSVVASTPGAAFAQSITDYDSLLQYAREARFILGKSGPADKDALERTGLKGAYTQFIGARRIVDKPALAITAIYVLAKYAPSEAVMKSLDGPVSEWIERTHAVRIARVTQRMEAVALNASQAKRLDVDTRSPALRTVRRYGDSAGKTLLLSESLHPAGRFAYEINLERTHL
jgi:GntR family transcriptional regulator